MTPTPTLLLLLSTLQIGTEDASAVAPSLPDPSASSTPVETTDPVEGSTDPVALAIALTGPGDSDDLRARLESAVVEGFGAPLVPPSGTATCEPADQVCIRDAAGERDALVTSVTVDEAESVITMTLVAPDGRVIASKRAQCELCGDDELAGRVRDEAGVMRARRERAASDEAGLTIVSDPTGAVVFIDGERVGKTPLEDHLIAAGRHTVRIEHQGYVTGELDWTGHAGVTDRIARVLEPVPVPTVAPSLPAEPAPAPPRDTGRPLAITGWSLVGVGVAGIVTGAVLLGVDGRDHDATCGATDRDAEGNCPNLVRTRGAGIGVLIAGGVLAGTGAGLLGYRWRRNRRTRAAVAAHVGPARVGVTVRF